MIDISKPHASLIRIIKNTDESTESFQAGEDLFQGDAEKKKLVQMINRFNPHICEAFYADKVLLVEGDTETIVYRELLSKFYPNEEMFVLNTGSKNNIPFFQEILTHFRIEHYIIHDSDTETTQAGKRNPAWALNDKIWSKVEESNGLARRYVHITNFETANSYEVKSDKGKPLSAYEFAQTITKGQDTPCLNWLKAIINKDKFILHDQKYIEDTVKNFSSDK